MPEGDPAWFIFDAVAQSGAQRMNLWHSMGSSNRLGDAFTQYHPTNFDLPVSDGRQLET